MGTLIDSSVLIAAERAEVARWTLPEDDEVGIAAITASELLHGVLRADRRRRAGREAVVESILAAVTVCPFGLVEARLHAMLWADAVARGRHPGAHELIIAATALALGWRLATLNRKHFAGIAGLQVVEPGG